MTEIITVRSKFTEKMNQNSNKVNKIQICKLYLNQLPFRGGFCLFVFTFLSEYCIWHVPQQWLKAQCRIFFFSPLRGKLFYFFQVHILFFFSSFILSFESWPLNVSVWYVSRGPVLVFHCLHFVVALPTQGRTNLTEKTDISLMTSYTTKRV
jgi:hypothetical protein